MKRKFNHKNIIGVASCLFELNGHAPTEIKVLPSGRFKAKDGRPHGLAGWNLSEQSAKTVIASANAQQDKFLIDYDHQTLYTKENGQPAPAAAWFKALEWRKDGLYALGVEWTESAKTAISANEYRYISPVLSYNKQTGEVTGLLMAALVNYPAIDGLTDLAAAKFNLTPEESMNPELLKLLGLAVDADDAAVLSAITALKSGSEQVAALSAQISTLKAQAPDPAKFVPIDAMSALQTQVAALSAQLNADSVGKLIEPALADGRLLPAQKEWAESLGKSDIAALSAYLDSAQPIAALKGTQTGGKAPEGDAAVALNDDDLAICSAMGIDPEEYKKTKGAE